MVLIPCFRTGPTNCTEVKLSLKHRQVLVGYGFGGGENIANSPLQHAYHSLGTMERIWCFGGWGGGYVANVDRDTQ